MTDKIDELMNLKLDKQKLETELEQHKAKFPEVFEFESLVKSNIQIIDEKIQKLEPSKAKADNTNKQVESESWEVFL